MNESSKNRERREREGFFTKYLQGHGIDIGCGDDPVTPGCDRWDLRDGDGQGLATIEDERYDYVYSSHFLEHVRDPLIALQNQWRVLRPGGYLITVVPDEDLYEQGVVPSVFNGDHKFTFTAHKDKTWSPISCNLIDLLKFLPEHRIVYVRTLDDGYDYSKVANGKLEDQTASEDRLVNACIESVVQKAPVQHTLRTRLRCLIMCPRCSRMSVVVRGIAQSGKYDIQCRDCGFVGEFALKQDD